MDVKIDQWKLAFSYFIIVLAIVAITILTHYISPGQYEELTLEGGKYYLVIQPDSENSDSELNEDNPPVYFEITENNNIPFVRPLSDVILKTYEEIESDGDLEEIQTEFQREYLAHLGVEPLALNQTEYFKDCPELKYDGQGHLSITSHDGTKYNLKLMDNKTAFFKDDEQITSETLIEQGAFTQQEINSLPKWNITHFLEDRTIIIPDTYKEFEGEKAQEYRQGVWDAIKSPAVGLWRRIFIAVFILVVGGSFFMVQRTGVIDAGISWLIDKYRDRPTRLIVLVMIVFSLAGSLFGMLEEMIPMVLIFIPIALMLGFDSIVGFAIVVVGIGTGFAAAVFNPFTVVIAQDVAQVTIYSGMGFRFLAWGVFIAVAILWVLWYAKRAKSKGKSLVKEIDKGRTQEIVEMEKKKIEVTAAHKRAAIVVGITFLVILIGVFMKWMLITFFEYNLFFDSPVIAGLFLIMGIVSGFAAGLKVKEVAKSFLKGIMTFAPAMIFIALSQAVLVIAEDGMIIHSILNSLAEGVGNIVGDWGTKGSEMGCAGTMYLIQMVINFFVPSGSGQAILTMPIMAPLADLFELPRQIAVLAFQFGDGFSNMIHPTNGSLVIGLAIAGLPYTKWFRFMIPLQIIFIVIAILLLGLAVLMGVS